MPFLLGKAGKRLVKNCHQKYCSVYYYYSFLNVYCIYFVLTLEATEWGSPRNLSDAVTRLQEYFTFKILGFTSVTSLLLLAITPRIIIIVEENTGNILPSQMGEKEKERRFGGWWNSNELLSPFSVTGFLTG